jgi:hypothetical protein
MGTFFNELEQALGGPTDPSQNRFLRETSGGTSFPANTRNKRPRTTRADMTRQRERQGGKVRERRVLLGEDDAEKPRMLKPSEKRGSRKPAKDGSQSTSSGQVKPKGGGAQPRFGEDPKSGVTPLQEELRKYDKASLRKTLTTIQGQSSDAKVFGSNLTVGEARDVIKKELQRRQ